jgi:hypothetical protein
MKPLCKQLFLTVFTLHFYSRWTIGAQNKFVQSPPDCDQDITLLILVHSAPSNDEKRNILRQTWTQNDPTFKTVFIIGRSLNKTLEERVSEESVHSQDILVRFLKTFFTHIRNFRHSVKFVLKGNLIYLIWPSTKYHYMINHFSYAQSRQGIFKTT